MESAETKRIINPRVEIDTSPPFDSVKEAVDHFGGGGAPWIPLHLLRARDNGSFGNENIEEEALQLERDLSVKEHETRNLLKELESAKQLVETLKLDLMPEFCSFLVEAPDYENSTEDCFSLTEMSHANLNRTSIDLAEIQQSLGTLNKRLGNDDSKRRDLLQVPIASDWGSPSDNCQMSMINRYLDDRFGTSDVVSLSKEESYEAGQFKKLTEASRYEMMRAVSEIEQTKNSIRMAEMRLNAAKKMEEAAKAIQAIAIEGGSNADFSNGNYIPRNLDWGKDFSMSKSMEKFDEEEEVSIQKHVVTERTRNDNVARFKFRNSYAGHRNPGNGPYTSKEEVKMTSIGDVIGRKLLVRDDAMMGRRGKDHLERGHVSLSQMLREQRRDTLPPAKRKEDVNVEKRNFFQRKFGFGFIPLQVYTKQSKK